MVIEVRVRYERYAQSFEVTPTVYLLEIEFYYLKTISKSFKITRKNMQPIIKLAFEKYFTTENRFHVFSCVQTAVSYE